MLTLKGHLTHLTHCSKWYISKGPLLLWAGFSQEQATPRKLNSKRLASLDKIWYGQTALIMWQQLRKAYTCKARSYTHSVDLEVNATRRLRAWSKFTRFALIWILFVVMALFYTIPIGAVQAIIEVDRLKNIPVFKQLVNISFIRSIIEAILPGRSSTLACAYHYLPEPVTITCESLTARWRLTDNAELVVNFRYLWIAEGRCTSWLPSERLKQEYDLTDDPQLMCDGWWFMMG